MTDDEIKAAASLLARTWIAGAVCKHDVNYRNCGLCMADKIAEQVRAAHEAGYTAGLERAASYVEGTAKDDSWHDAYHDAPMALAEDLRDLPSPPPAAVKETFVPLSPDAEPRFNGGQRCDMESGPCACGAWHKPAAAKETTGEAHRLALPDGRYEFEVIQGALVARPLVLNALLRFIRAETERAPSPPPATASEPKLVFSCCDDCRTEPCQCELITAKDRAVKAEMRASAAERERDEARAQIGRVEELSTEAQLASIKAESALREAEASGMALSRALMNLRAALDAARKGGG